MSLSLLIIWMLGCASQQKTEWFWVKPGGTSDALNKDKYTCAQESQQRVSKSQHDGYTGSSESVDKTNVDLYNLCMQARGWVLEADAYGFEPKATRLLETEKKKVSNKSRIIATDDRFIAYENGTVQDTSSKLMWAARDNGSDINWKGAKKYCEDFSCGGYTDWRMPTAKELMTLYDVDQSIPIPRFPRKNMMFATKLIGITTESCWTNLSGKDFNFITGKEQNFLSGFSIAHRALPVR